MTTENHIYVAIDLKSFYASVECMQRNLDTMTTTLVVADASRTEKTICLAVSPAPVSYTHLDVYKRQEWNRAYIPVYLQFETVKVQQYRSLLSGDCR